MAKKVDLRKDFDIAMKVKGGVVYRKGKIIQVWWKTTESGYVGPETWTSPNIKQAEDNFNDMIERWSY